MKCVCGYRKGMEWVDNGIDADEYVEVNPTGDEFIRIKGNFTTAKEYDRVEEVSMYACPECGTVQMKKY